MGQLEKKEVSTTSGYRIVLILLGIAMTPILLSSSGLGSQIGSHELLPVVMIGGIILTALSAMTLSIGQKARLPTYGVVKYPFGKKGAVAINILMAISLSGWIAVTANQFGTAIHDLLLNYGVNIPAWALIIAGCILFVWATTLGFNVLNKIALFAVPVIVLVLAYILMQVLSKSQVGQSVSSMNMGVAVSAVVGTIIVLVTTSVDFGSMVHDRKHAVIAAVLTFLIAYPLLYWAGAMPTQISHAPTLLDAAKIFGLTVPVALLMTFATFTGNAGNMFQGSLAFSTLLPNVPKWQITIGLGIFAAIVANLNILGWFIPFLLFLGIVTPPVAGIYIADYFLYRRKTGYSDAQLNKEADIKITTFIAWGVAALVGFMGVKGWLTITTIPSLDSILIACVAYTIFSKLGRSKN